MFGFKSARSFARQPCKLKNKATIVRREKKTSNIQQLTRDRIQLGKNKQPNSRRKPTKRGGNKHAKWKKNTSKQIRLEASWSSYFSQLFDQAFTHLFNFVLSQLYSFLLFFGTNKKKQVYYYFSRSIKKTKYRVRESRNSIDTET